MKTSLKILIIAALALLGIEVAFSAGYIADAGFHKVRESFYSVYSHGFKVGEVKAVCEPLPVDNKKRFRFHSETTVQASFLFYSYNLAKTEEALVTDDGAYYYKRTSMQNGKGQQVEGQLQRNGFVFTIEENGEKHTQFIGRDEYDSTTMDCPEVTMGPEEKEKIIRVLDFEHLKVLKRSYKWLKNEDIQVEGKPVQCKVIEFADAYKRCRRWVKIDELGVLVVRQDGNGKDGSYSTRIVSLSVKPQINTE
jgi:hypothetical protein